MTREGGAVACGHPVTCRAAEDVLRAGGNAFDAAAAALWTACVAEPVLASLGGGGFLMARPPGEEARIYDFFTHTPHRRIPRDSEDFREIQADFGAAQQGFQIGLGSAATPGMVAGIFRFHSELGSLPRSEVMAPAIEAARRGVPLNQVGAYLLQVLSPILTATPGAEAIFAPNGSLLTLGDTLRQGELAGLLEALLREGPDLFYRGDVAARIERTCGEGGGHLTLQDFHRYQVHVRRPLATSFLTSKVWSNPAPASGGLMVAFALQMLEDQGGLGDATEASLRPVLRAARALWVTQQARLQEGLLEGLDDQRAQEVLAPGLLARYRALTRQGWPATRGTTHISVVDSHGGAAAVTVSNGEGCGWMVPGTGFMLNNMLGEEDLQPGGFQRWPLAQRLTSMMAPTLVEEADGATTVLGSGGSNRIRSALVQVLQGLLGEGLPLESAIASPRVHVEGNTLEVEGGFASHVVSELVEAWPSHRIWDGRNLFFGGVHAVRMGPGLVEASGDPRRGGVSSLVK